MQFIIQGSKLITQRAAAGADLTKYFSRARVERFDDTGDNRLVIQKMLTKAFSGPAGAGAFRNGHCSTGSPRPGPDSNWRPLPCPCPLDQAQYRDRQTCAQRQSQCDVDDITKPCVFDDRQALVMKHGDNHV